MTTYTHQTAPTQFVEANGIRFAYRRFGKAPEFDPNLFLDGIDPQYEAELKALIRGVPLVLNQHFTGTMDHWDPAVTDGLAKTREVSYSTTRAFPAPAGRCRRRSKKWQSTRRRSSGRLASPRSTSSVSLLAA